MIHHGDFDVKRALSAQRLNLAMRDATITAQENLNKFSETWQRLSAAAAQDAVLPDATTLPEGWEIIVEASGAATVTVKTYHATTPVTLQAVASGEAFCLTLKDNATAAGTWHITKLAGSDMSASTRYTATFNATTDWGSASGGYYSQAIAESTHGRGASPIVQLFEVSGSDYLECLADQVKFNAVGDITLRVTESPDGRFAGKAVIV